MQIWYLPTKVLHEVATIFYLDLLFFFFFSYLDLKLICGNNRKFSGPYFSSFGLSAMRYVVSLCIQSEFEKIKTRKTSNMDTFQAVMWFILFEKCLFHKRYMNSNTFLLNAETLSLPTDQNWKNFHVLLLHMPVINWCMKS